MRIAAMAAALALAACATVGSGPMGVRPTYLEAVTENVPNAQAIVQRIWTPGLDDGWVPQGLTVAGDRVLISQYHPMPDLKANTGPCRIVALDMASGRTVGSFDMPVGLCTHSGGLAWLGNGQLFLADTRTIFRIDLERALASGKAEGAMKSLKLSGDLRGSFAASDGTDPWIGTWTKNAVDKSRMYHLDTALFDQYDGQVIDHAKAKETIPVPLESQGAAFAPDGTLWTSASNSKWGKLYHLARDGRILATHEMTAGLEDLNFDSRGRLWGLSESGTRKYLSWATHFPFVFAIDVQKLR
jgi:hypothetical protein